MNRVAWFMLLTLLTAMSLTLMQDTLAAAEDVLRPCQGDVQNFCADVKPGQGRMSKCLKEHEANLSQACKSHLKTMFAHMQEAREACSEDAKKLCKDMSPGHGRIVACLKQHESELSDACKEEMKQ